MKRAVIAAAAFALGIAYGADFPRRPLHIVVPNPPGGTVDLVARTIANAVSPALGQPVVIDIRTGGNSIIGSETVARAAPDGYTLLMGATHVTLNPLLRKLPYDGLQAFEPVALIATVPNVIAVRPSHPAHSLGELLAAAKRAPGTLNCATSNQGSGIHLAAERFKRMAGIDVNLVPYQGGVKAVIGVVSGDAPMLLAPLSDAAPHIASGRLRPLAVTSLKRSALLPDVPTLDELGFRGFNAVQWFGVLAPAGTPRATIERLSNEMLKAADSAATRAAFAKFALTAEPLPPDRFAEFLRAETGMFAEVLRDTPVKPD